MEMKTSNQPYHVTVTKYIYRMHARAGSHKTIFKVLTIKPFVGMSGHEGEFDIVGQLRQAYL
jgi:hypothetical protein